MAQPNRSFKDRIDRSVDPELLETEMRSLHRLLSATRKADRFREATAKSAYILERLKMLAEEEAAEEPDRV